MFNACLVAIVFPRQWKMAPFVLLNRGKGPDSLSSYRPLYMLNTIGKVMGSMLRERLRKSSKKAVAFLRSSMDSVKGILR